MMRRQVLSVVVFCVAVLLLAGGGTDALACSVAAFNDCPVGCICSGTEETRTCTNSGCPSSTSCGAGHTSTQIWCGTSSDGRNEYYKTRCSLTGTDYTCDECLDGYFGSGCAQCPDCGGPEAGECNDGMTGDGGCTCNDGYAGSNCQYSDAATCKDHGEAQDDGSCICDEGYAGMDCGKKTSPSGITGTKG